MTRLLGRISGLLTAMLAILVIGTSVPEAGAAQFSIARIYWEYNSSANDLGVHVLLDAEDWRSLKIIHPNGKTIFSVTPNGGWGKLGLTEMFFEGAEPSLDDFPLDELLALFPEGQYKFTGTTVDGTALQSFAKLSHAIPAGPAVSVEIDDDDIKIKWKAVTEPPNNFPAKKIQIVGYQVIVGSFQVTMPASSRSVTLPEEYAASLPSGSHQFEVLAIDVSGNQTITEGSFTK